MFDVANCHIQKLHVCVCVRVCLSQYFTSINQVGVRATEASGKWAPMFERVINYRGFLFVLSFDRNALKLMHFVITSYSALYLGWGKVSGVL